MLLVDRNGSPIRVGSRVAYNLGGLVALGTVRRLTYDRREPVFIQPDPAWSANVQPGNLSKVKHRWSLVVVG